MPLSDQTMHDLTLSITSPPAHYKTHTYTFARALSGIKVDMAACRALRPEMLTFEQWLVKVGYDKMKLEQPSMCVIS